MRFQKEEAKAKGLDPSAMNMNDPNEFHGRSWPKTPTKGNLWSENPQGFRLE